MEYFEIKNRRNAIQSRTNKGSSSAMNQNWNHAIWNHAVSGGYAQATASQIGELAQLAASGKYGSIHAAAILENITGEIAEEELNYPDFATKSLKAPRPKGIKPSLAGVYPNPASGEFYITYVLPTERKSASVLIYDAIGQHVRTEDVTNGFGILTMDARTFSPGTFVFQLLLEGKTVASEKFVITK